MKVTIDIKCPCGCSTKVTTKKASYFTPTSDVCRCDECGSKLQFIMKHVSNGKRRGQVSLQVRMVERSKVLQAIVDEEEADRLKEQQAVIKEVEGDRHSEAGV